MQSVRKLIYVDEIRITNGFNSRQATKAEQIVNLDPEGIILLGKFPLTIKYFPLPTLQDIFLY